MHPVHYMARNRVAANLLMLLFLVGGGFALRALNIEVFPEIDLNRISVRVIYPGASPDEIEEGICQPIEEALQGIDGIDRLQATAIEGVGNVIVEVRENADDDDVLQDIKSAVDRIVTFPNDSERPIVRKLSNRKAVLSVAVYGDLDTWTLREQAERVNDDLLGLEGITQTELSGIPPFEISVEVKEATLRRYDLTLDRIAQAIRESALDLPGGAIKRDAGDILIRTKERRYLAREYRSLPIRSQRDGSEVRLGDIADITEGFAETDERATYNGKSAAMVDVFRVGDQSPIEVSKIVERYLEGHRIRTAKSVHFAIWHDRSKMLNGRLGLLIKNALLGLILVVIVLGLFLQVRLALWITAGIPISIFGALLLLPGFDVSINMISLFAFILVLGIVVDDAIVVGENAYAHRLLGKSALQAAADGAVQVGRPVTFSILTTIAAFSPLLFIPGTMGKFLRAIPLIVIAVLLVSLLESLFVLPAHLSHEPPKPSNQRPNRFAIFQAKIAASLDRFVEGPYRRVLSLILQFRYPTLAFSATTLLLTIGLFIGGHIKLVFLPELDGDIVRAKISMPFGTAAQTTEEHLQRLITAAQQTVKEFDRTLEQGDSANPKSDRPTTNLRGIFSIVGQHLQGEGPPSTGSEGASHLGEVAVFLQEAELRSVTSSQFAARWRELVGSIPGVEQLDFQSQVIRTGSPIAIQLAHERYDVLEKAAKRLKERLSRYAGLHDIADTYEAGKPELQLRIKPEARSLGLTTRNLATQVRAAFYGSEALRMQRGRNEVKVMVRYPRSDRRSLVDIQDMRIRTPGGGEIPFGQAASIETSRGYSVVERSDRKRVVVVNAKADLARVVPAEIIQEVQKNFLPRLVRDYPGLSHGIEGEQREQARTISALRTGFLAALGLIFALLAIPFGSYSQPLIIMTAIPFGIIGAVIGHFMLGYNISLMSLFGVVALTGVVVNDSLVLIDFINRNRQKATSTIDAVLQAATRRFRPIILTTLTTFFALVPMLLETSVQARFLIPMAISLSFGVLFATIITLVLIPTLYVILEDIKGLLRRSAL